MGLTQSLGQGFHTLSRSLETQPKNKNKANKDQIRDFCWKFIKEYVEEPNNMNLDLGNVYP